ncbi:anti-sigma factor [Agromyces subbeticus]|uniref:anti-sigma factor n=1 Tax=Agromyces subbeticus TaxID=293890 RepID=UPI0003B63C2A|nr:anti-sigma factor [Agromyces subbeticus]
MTEPDDPRDDRDETPAEPQPDSTEGFQRLAAAHALDALDQDDLAAFVRALDADPELRDELDRYAEAAAQLGAATLPEAPPPALKARLMAQLDEVPQQRPDPELHLVPDAASAPAASEARPGPAEQAARRRWFQRPGAVIAVAAASVALVTGAIVGVGWSGPNGWGAQREMAAIAEAPDVQTVTHEVEGGGAITLYWSADQARSGVVVEGLPDVGDDETYELWYIDEAGAQSAGTFDVRGDETWRVLDGSFAPGVAVGVTVEPAGGSPQPTTDPIVVIAT